MDGTLLSLVIIIQHAVYLLLEELKSPLGLIPIGHFFTLLMQTEDPHVEVVHDLLEGCPVYLDLDLFLYISSSILISASLVVN